MSEVDTKKTTSRKQVYDDDDEFDLPVSKKARESELASDTSSESTGEPSGDDRLQRMAGALKTILEVSTYWL